MAKCIGFVLVGEARLERMSSLPVSTPPRTPQIVRTTEARDANRGLLLGAIGVFIFAVTIPMTRLAIGFGGSPQLDPIFVTAGRAAVAGLMSIVYLWLSGAPKPTRRQALILGLTGLGVVFGFPLFLALAVREVDAIHASVISGLLPLATAAIAALALRQRPSPGFWACALLGLVLVLAFAWWRGASGFQWADGLLMLAVLTGAGGYVSGGMLSRQMTAEQVICWVLVMYLPLTVPLALLNLPTHPVSVAAWGAFAYVSLFSMWIGFFAWYRALAIGGTVRVSQVQVIQPFLSMLLAVPLLGERLDAMTMVFALAVIAVVWLGKRMPVDRVA